MPNGCLVTSLHFLAALVIFLLFAVPFGFGHVFLNERMRICQMATDPVWTAACTFRPMYAPTLFVLYIAKPDPEIPELKMCTLARNAVWRILGFRGLRQTRRRQLVTLCSPNEDFGDPNKALRARFGSTFPGCEYSIWATHHRKFVQKRTRNALFESPNSSFGEHKIMSNGTLWSPNTHLIVCNSFRNLIHPKRRLWKAKPTFQNAFSKHFPRA